MGRRPVPLPLAHSNAGSPPRDDKHVHIMTGEP